MWNLSTVPPGTRCAAAFGTATRRLGTRSRAWWTCREVLCVGLLRGEELSGLQLAQYHTKTRVPVERKNPRRANSGGRTASSSWCASRRIQQFRWMEAWSNSLPQTPPNSLTGSFRANVYSFSFSFYSYSFPFTRSRCIRFRFFDLLVFVLYIFLVFVTSSIL